MPEVVASILAENRPQVHRAAQRAAMLGADWIELRLDRWPADADLAPLLSGIRLPVMVACRTSDDGGFFKGALSERRQLLTRALEAGAQGLDLEDWESWSPSLGQNRLRLLIRSHHCLTGVPDDLEGIRDRLFQMQCNVAKIAVLAHDLADAMPVIDLLAATDQRQRPTVAFAMGRSAWPTRILAAVMGAPLVYASAAPQAETAPGQPPVDLVAGLYRVRELSGHTSVFGLLGNPALHSLGPWLHNRALRRLGHDGVYLPLETSRPESVMAMLPRRLLRGLSVTAPHKAVMAGQCHRLSDSAARIGVVNTVTLEAHGMVVGHNTDVIGVTGALRRAGLSERFWDRARGGAEGVVLGTGGAARAGAVALAELGFSVTMLGRSLDAARKFTNHHGFRLGTLSASVLDDLQPAVVVHATPVGSAGRSDSDERLVPEWQPRPESCVLDMVYQPARTRLLRDAEAAGAHIVTGTEMFLTQAAAQLSLFTGQSLDEDELRAFFAGAS